MVDDVGKKERIGLVLSGGGARGAYEAGVLSVLGPVLDRRGERPTICVGTSVGAVNAAYLASTAHLSAEEAITGGLERWSTIRMAQVLKPLVRRQVPLTLLRYAG